MEQHGTTIQPDGIGLFRVKLGLTRSRQVCRNVRGFIRELLEQELTAAQGRLRPERADEDLVGYPNGTRER